MFIFHKYLLSIIVLFTFSLSAQELDKVTVNEDNLLLLTINLNAGKLGQSIDAYQQDDQLLLAIEPLFDILQVKYQLYKNKVTIWKGEEKFEFSFENKTQSALSESSLLGNNIWADDGYYVYLSSKLFKELFGAEVTLDRRKLLLDIKTKNYQFPLTVLAKQAKKRFLSQMSKRSENNNPIEVIPITIEDQYRLATVPTGHITSQIALDDNKQNNNITVQLVSDLLYHSANININKSKGSDITGGLSLSRYKTSSNNHILGAFDYYKLGDISSINNSRLSKGKSGVGVNFVRAPKSFRRENGKITLEQVAPPGWEAELYHNNQFVEVVTVPETGLLVFEDTELIYGNNRFAIKLYGPFGEQQEFIENYNLKANPLSAGAMAYSLYTLDAGRTLFNNGQEQDSFELDTFGGTFDYGINDLWQVGVGFSQNKPIDSNENNEQFFNVKNNLSLPGILLENELVVDNDGNYQQQTSMLGRIFSEGSYNINFDSGSGGFDGVENRTSGKFESLSTTYSNSLSGLRYKFGARYSNNEHNKISSLSNTLAYRFKNIAITHDIDYSEFSQKNINSSLIESSNYNVNGRLGISTAISRDFRLAANIAYNPKDEDDIISKNSSFSASWRLTDPWDLSHYLNLYYRPITDTDKKWQLSHNLAWEAPSHRLSLRTRYDQSNDWSLSLNFSFFFGYDYHNNRAHFSNHINTHSASLNIHNYLDRQHNGRPDVLDYNLEDVTYTGNPAWVDRTSGKDGRIILHGAKVNQPFKFQAHWKNGTETIKNDYVIYTHPGARVDVNMPFYLSSELAGFVYRGANEVPVSNVVVDLIDDTGSVVDTINTDMDGYYEFVGIKPNRYQVRINQQNLRDKGLTSEVVGFHLMTPSSGGFAELPTIVLSRIEQENETEEERVIPFIISEEMQEPLIYVDDATVLKNMFVLPVTEQVEVEHDLSKALDVVDTISKKSEMIDVIVPAIKHNKDPVSSSAEVSDNRTLNGSNLENNASSKLVQSNNSVEGFSLQLGSFYNLSGAEAIVLKYQSKGLLPKIKRSINEINKDIYRVYLGEFTTKTQASNFAKNNRLSANDYLIRSFSFDNPKEEKIMPKKDSLFNSADIIKINKLTRMADFTASEKWVIQLYANKAEFDINTVKPFYGIASLKHALKKVKGSEQPWYCLISGPYQSKQQALDEVERLNLTAWVTELSNYDNITEVIKE